MPSALGRSDDDVRVQCLWQDGSPCEGRIQTALLLAVKAQEGALTRKRQENLKAHPMGIREAVRIICEGAMRETG
jgi:hypothetical protein